MHLYLYCTVVTFGMFALLTLRRSLSHDLGPLVTAVFWAILKKDTTFATTYDCSYLSWIRYAPTDALVAWHSITFHALNAVFVVVEATTCRVPMPWGHLLLCVITLGLYLGLTYMVHGIQNWYGKAIITV
jgi:hypothetical protein